MPSWRSRNTSVSHIVSIRLIVLFLRNLTFTYERTDTSSELYNTLHIFGAGAGIHRQITELQRNYPTLTWQAHAPIPNN